MLSTVVGAGAGAAAENDVGIGISSGLEDGDDTILGDAGEPVRGTRRKTGVDSDLDRAVGCILEANRHRKT